MMSSNSDNYGVIWICEVIFGSKAEIGLFLHGNIPAPYMGMG